jgi:RNA polymerase sigma-54 factor
MAFRQKIEQRQKPIFTQGLRQSVEILELPLLELKETVDTELAENPVIEEMQAPAASAAAPEPLEQRMREDEDRSNFNKGTPLKEFDSFENSIPGKKDSLAETLLKQLRINAKDDEEARLGTIIIQQIDENGYLRKDISALTQEAGVNEKDMLQALELIQTFDPQGIGARDLKECLLIQLKKNREKNKLAYSLVENYLPELAGKDLNKLCKKLKCSQEELSQSIAKIHSLEPKPGRSFNYDEVAYVIPDIIIEEKGNELLVSIKDDVIPVIRINPLYRSMLKSEKVNDQTKEFIRERILRANNLIRAIESRKNTLSKVVSLIAETQKEALLEGIEKLVPLSLKEVAEKAGLHESTVSRVVANKYIQAPSGIFTLKDLFSFSLKTSEGEEIAAQRIKSKIQELIEAEDKTKPLKDHEIVCLIKESEKIPIARRTIAKYREGMNIPPTSQRKKPVYNQ